MSWIWFQLLKTVLILSDIVTINSLKDGYLQAHFPCEDAPTNTVVATMCPLIRVVEWASQNTPYWLSRTRQTSFFGAGNGAQTRNFHLGRVTLYQLSYARIKENYAFLFFRASWPNRTIVPRLQIMCNNRYTKEAFLLLQIYKKYFVKPNFMAKKIVKKEEVIAIDNRRIVVPRSNSF